MNEKATTEIYTLSLHDALPISGERHLGVDEKSGNNVYARIGPFGPMVQIGERQETDDDPKPKYASLIGDQTIQTISLEQALALFKLPRVVGEFEGEEVVAAIGRFGPYLRHKGKFTSVRKADNDDPHTITLERAIELIKAKIRSEERREGKECRSRWSTYQ